MTARVREFDDLVREKVSKAKLEMEQRLRAQIEQEMKDEMEAMERREVSCLNYIPFSWVKLFISERIERALLRHGTRASGKNQSCGGVGKKTCELFYLDNF